jgi:SLOG cluster4 family
MRIAVVGSRNYPNLVQVRDFVAALDPATIVVTGGARGVDREVERAARDAHLSIVILPALWYKYGNKAGPIRNAEIVATVDQVVAFWDGMSPGTASVIALAEKANKPLRVFQP